MHQGQLGPDHNKIDGVGAGKFCQEADVIRKYGNAFGLLRDAGIAGGAKQLFAQR